MSKKKRYYIKPPQATGRKQPFTFLIVLWLLADRLNAPRELIGIYWFIAIIFTLFYMYDLFSIQEIMVDAQKFLKDHHEEQEQEKKTPTQK